MQAFCANCPSCSDSLFKHLDPTALDHISESKTCIKYKKGQTIFYEGTRPLGIFCLKSGNVKVHKMTSHGKDQIIYLANAGSLLGYRALLGEEFYSSSATVIQEAQICFIPKEQFLQALKENPVFSQQITKAVCRELGVAQEKLTDLAQKSVRERLAGNLLMLKETYGVEGGESTLIDIALSREDLANIVGTATETIIRLLSDFKSSGLISLEGKKIKILDPKALAKEADFYG